jgi:hypothetical protein
VTAVLLAAPSRFGTLWRIAKVDAAYRVRHGGLGRLAQSQIWARGRLWPSFFIADSTGAIFGLAVAIRLKICMLVMDEPIATLKGAARLFAPGLSHDKAATPTRKTSDIDHFERACGKSEDAACEVIE